MPDRETMEGEVMERIIVPGKVTATIVDDNNKFGRRSERGSFRLILGFTLTTRRPYLKIKGKLHRHFFI